MPRTYKVLLGEFAHKKGEVIDGNQGYNYEALVDAGILRVEPLEPVACPACTEQGTPKKPPKFETQEELEDHYADKHPALAVPDIEEVPV